MASCGQCSTGIEADCEVVCDVCKFEFCSVCLPLTASEVKVIQLKKRTMLICCKACKLGVQGLLRKDEKINHLLEEVRLLSATIADKNELLEDKSKIINLLEKSCNGNTNGGPTSLHMESHSKPDKTDCATIPKKAVSAKAVSAAIENAKAVSTIQRLIYLDDQTVNSQDGSSINKNNGNLTLSNQEAVENNNEGFKMAGRRRKHNRAPPTISSGPQQSGRPAAHLSRRRQNGVIGIGGDREDVKVAPKKFFMHISRFAADTPTESVKGIILDKCPEVECKPVKSKHPEHYSSFMLTVNAENRNVAMDPKNWPAGIFINRFFLRGRGRGAGEPTDN